MRMSVSRAALRLSLLPPLLFLGLAACADGRSGYPSLAPRPIEREVLRVDVVSPAAGVDGAGTGSAPLPPSADIAQIVARAQAADAAFRAALEKGRARIVAGRAAAEGSEAWADGQIAYSEADAARAPVGEALAELDGRRQAAIDAGDGAQEAAIAEAAIQLQALHEAQSAQLAALTIPA